MNKQELFDELDKYTEDEFIEIMWEKDFDGYPYIPELDNFTADLYDDSDPIWEYISEHEDETPEVLINEYMDKQLPETFDYLYDREYR